MNTSPDGNRPLSFCERSTATIYTGVHIREVGPEGLKPGGGIPSKPLCGSDLRAGWDLNQAVTAEAIESLRDVEVNKVCRECGDLAVVILSDREDGAR